LGACFTDTAKKMRFLANQLESNIPSWMTSVVQPTDTDFSHEFKSKCKKRMAEHLLKGEIELGSMGISDSWTPSLENILETLAYAQNEMQANGDWILPSMRRNGWFNWRPGVAGFELCDNQEWAKNMPQGSARMRKEWLLNRSKWVNEKFEPLEPDWKLSQTATEIADLIEWDYYNVGDQKLHLTWLLCQKLYSWLAQKPQN
jgi:hypothetical protein